MQWTVFPRRREALGFADALDRWRGDAVGIGDRVGGGVGAAEERAIIAIKVRVIVRAELAPARILPSLVASMCRFAMSPSADAIAMHVSGVACP